MPISFGIRKSELLNESLFGNQIRFHFFYGNIIVTDGRRFAISTYPHEFKLNNKSWLMGFCSFGNGEGMMEREIVYFVFYFQGISGLKFWVFGC